MIADYNTMPRMFWECNRLYFDHQLRTPKFGLMHSYRTLGKFAYQWGEKKKPVGSSQNSVDSALIGPQNVIRFSVIYIN